MNRVHSSRQRGMALLIALIVLVVVSILGATAMRSALFQNRVSINQQMSQMIFQGAESGIRGVLMCADPNEFGRCGKPDAPNPADPDNPDLNKILPQNPLHIFFQAFMDEVPQQICYDESGDPTATDLPANAVVVVGNELEYDFVPCPANDGSPLRVTAIVSRPPPGLPITMPVEGYNLGHFDTAQIYSRSFASINNATVRSSHVQMWGVIAPSPDE